MNVDKETYYRLKALQIKDAYLVSRKQSEDEKICEVNVRYELESWFRNVLNIILSALEDDFDNTRYLFQVEEIISNHREEYKTILAESIQDFYIASSENTEALLNNSIAQKRLDRHILINTITRKDEQGFLDDWLYNNQNTKAITNNIKKKLRYNNNVQQSLDRYINRNNINLHGWNPTELTVNELFEYEVDQAVIEYMSENIFVASESTLERVTQEIYDIIREHYADEGEGSRAVAEAVRESFNELAQYEAERIARTEVAKAQGHSTWKRLVNNEAVEYFQWLATDDDRTRESHLELNGEITYADGSGVFSNGLRFPGDTDGDIEEWINCRCTLRAFVPEVGFVPPPGAENWYEDEMLFDTSLEIPEVYVEMDEYLASYW